MLQIGEACLCQDSHSCLWLIVTPLVTSSAHPSSLFVRQKRDPLVRDGEIVSITSDTGWKAAPYDMDHNLKGNVLCYSMGKNTCITNPGMALFGICACLANSNLRPWHRAGPLLTVPALSCVGCSISCGRRAVCHDAGVCLRHQGAQRMQPCRTTALRA